MHAESKSLIPESIGFNSFYREKESKMESKRKRERENLVFGYASAGCSSFFSSLV